MILVVLALAVGLLIALVLEGVALGLSVRWLLRLLDSTLAEGPATGRSSVVIDATGPVDVYLRVARFSSRLTNLRAEVQGPGGVVPASWRTLTIGPLLRPGVATYKGGTTLSAAVGRLELSGPGTYEVIVTEGASDGTLLYCRPTGWWIPVAIVGIALCSVALVGTLIGMVFLAVWFTGA